MPIDARTVTWDAPDPKTVKWDASPLAATERNRLRETAEGVLRGAAGIGNTLLTPVRKAASAVGADSVADYLNSSLDAQKSMDAQNADSNYYGGAKLATEVGMTLPVGGVLARGAAMLPGANKALPLIDAIRTGGFSAGGATGAAGVGARAVGGGITGAASAGLVNPEDAGLGAVVGAGLPGALQLAGKAGSMVGGVLRGPEQSAELAAAIRAARDAGYVIPPTQARPSLGNRLIEGLSGKITTAQNASARNQGVTNKLAAEGLGLPGDTKLTPELLTDIRTRAGQAYEAIGSTGTVTAPFSYAAALDAIAAPFKRAAGGFPNAKPSPVIDLVESLKSPQFDAAAAVAKIKELRTAADDAYRTGNTDIGRASKAAAKALEDVIDGHLQGIGSPELLTQFRDARQLIAKTYTVEKALNPTSGSVDARKLAAQLNKGKPLSGDLKTAASFANQFPKAAQAVEGMGSLPQLSPLDWAAGGAMSAATASPIGMIGLLARPAARGAALSAPVQNRLLQRQSRPSPLLFDDLTRYGLLSAPVIAVDQ